MALRPFPSAIVRSVPWWRGSRLAGVLLVACVHILLVTFLLSGLPKFVMTLPAQREIFFIFHPRAKPVRLPRMKPVPQARLAPPPLFHYAPRPATAGNSTAPPTDRGGLGLSLFGCAPENLANLSPRERAHCTDSLSAVALQSAIPGNVVEQALQSGRWSAAIARRNTPLTVPCTSDGQMNASGPGQTANVVMVDPICVVRGVLNGFGPEK